MKPGLFNRYFILKKLRERSEQFFFSHNHTKWKPKTAKDGKAGKVANWNEYDFTMAQQNLKYLWICAEKRPG